MKASKERQHASTSEDSGSGSDRPVAARTVAQALAELTTAPEWTAAARSAEAPILEIAGPREESLGEMARRLVTRRGEQVRIEVVSNPADPDRELYENGALLPGPHAILAGPTFEEWLYNEEQTKPTTSS